MLVKSGSKLYIAGEYAILSENSYALISYIPKYTYLDIEFSEKMEIITDINDKDNLIGKTLKHIFNYLGKEYTFRLKYFSELYKGDVKYGLGSSASVVAVTLKAIFEILKKSYTKKELFDLAIDIMIKENVSGSFGDLACIIYEKDILFKSSDREKRLYSIIHLEIETNIEIIPIWTKSSASTSKLISKLDITKESFKRFKDISNNLVLTMLDNLKDNKVDMILEIIDKLNENLHFLEKEQKILIHTDDIEKLLKGNPHSKISGAGGGDFIIHFKKSEEKKKFKVSFNEELI